MTQSPRAYRSFAEFWPFYLAQHSKPSTRRWHFLGNTLALVCLLLALTSHWLYLALGVVLGYGSAWVGHFFFEKNRPATFTYPLYSFAGDWKMYFLMLTGRLDAEIRSLGEQGHLRSDEL